MKKFYDLYIADTDILYNDDIFSSLYNMISEFRQNKIDSFKFRKDKNLSLAASLLLEKIIPVSNPKYKLSETGKPYFKNINLFFSISHSGTKALCAFSNIECGCDIEFIHDINFDIAKKYFSSSEYDEIVHSKNPTLTFFKLWTAKEAYIKAYDSKSLESTKDVFSKSSFKTFELENYIISCCSPDGILPQQITNIDITKFLSE